MPSKPWHGTSFFVSTTVGHCAWKRSCRIFISSSSVHSTLRFHEADKQANKANKETKQTNHLPLRTLSAKFLQATRTVPHVGHSGATVLLRIRRYSAVQHRSCSQVTTSIDCLLAFSIQKIFGCVMDDKPTHKIFERFQQVTNER